MKERKHVKEQKRKEGKMEDKVYIWSRLKKEIKKKD